MPYEQSGCDAGQAPNGDLPADGAVSTLSHELIEAMTDPLDPQYAWSDKAGNEIGDMCAQTYGRALGSTDPSDPSASEYNQVINGGKYYIQQMFSNLAYAKFGERLHPERGAGGEPERGGDRRRGDDGGVGLLRRHTCHSSCRWHQHLEHRGVRP